jgi:hypothetical protein
LNNFLKKLYNYLYTHNLHKEANEVENLEEDVLPWEIEHDKLQEEDALEFGSEPISEEEYLNQVSQKSYMTDSDLADDYNKIAEQEGFKIVSSGEEKPLLGRGSYGSVFQGVYKGKLAAIKIILNSNGEVENWQKILQITQSFPENLKKHFPVIYHLNKGVLKKEKNQYVFGINYEIIIMEKLFKLPKDIYLNMDDNPMIDKSKMIKDLFKDDDYLYTVSSLIVDGISKNPYFRMDMRNFQLNTNEIFKLLSSQKLDDKSFPSSTIMAENISNFLLQKYPFREKYKEKVFPIIKAILNNSIGKVPGVPRGYYGITTPKDFHDYEYYSPVWEHRSETKELYEALLMLGSAGVKWNDLHVDNLMMGADGTIKFIDAGLFGNE